MAEVVYGRLDVQLPPLQVSVTGTVRAAVDAVAEVVERTNATPADLQAFADLMREAVRDGVSAGIAAARIEQGAPQFRSLETWVRANQGLRDVLLLLVAVATVVMSILQNDNRQEPATSDGPAQVEPLDRSEIERATEDRMSEPDTTLVPETPTR